MVSRRLVPTVWMYLAIGFACLLKISSQVIPTSPLANETFSVTNVTTSPQVNVTTPNQKETQSKNCTAVIRKKSSVEVQLIELKNGTNENFNSLHDTLAQNMEKSLTNLTQAFEEVYADNDKVLKQLKKLEQSFDEIKKDKKETEEVLRSMNNDQISCEFVKRNFSANMTPKSGIYWLRDRYGKRYFTYCEFDDSGRSWTLVASVHENQMGVNGRCGPGDKWSNEQGMWEDVVTDEETAWSDERIFGDVTTSSSGDFKSPGYYSIHAKNVMIWHVREHTPLDEYKNQAYLRYRTTDNFLKKYGGNLQRLFRDHYPHKPAAANFGQHGPKSKIVYDKGDSSEHSYLLAPKIRSYVNSDYIQFRTLNHDRDSFAICPGFYITNQAKQYHIPELLCIGSNKKTKSKDYCGDFANWDKSGYGSGADYSATSLLVKTSFLIFYG